MNLSVNSQLYRLVWHKSIRQQQLAGNALRGTESSQSNYTAFDPKKRNSAQLTKQRSGRLYENPAIKRMA